MGIESVDPDVLKQMQKGQNTVMPPLEAVRRIQGAGLEVSGGFIVGTDGESDDDSASVPSLLHTSSLNCIRINGIWFHFS